MITHVLIWVGEPDPGDDAIMVRFVACGMTANRNFGKLAGSIAYGFGASVAQKKTALWNKVQAELPGHYPGIEFSATVIVEYLGL